MGVAEFCRAVTLDRRGVPIYEKGQRNRRRRRGMRDETQAGVQSGDSTGNLGFASGQAGRNRETSKMGCEMEAIAVIPE
jgi:hypothetical protein